MQRVWWCGLQQSYYYFFMFLVGVISESGLKNSLLFSLQSTKCVVHYYYVYFVNFLREKTFLSQHSLVGKDLKIVP